MNRIEQLNKDTKCPARLETIQEAKELFERIGKENGLTLFIISQTDDLGYEEGKTMVCQHRFQGTYIEEVNNRNIVAVMCCEIEKPYDLPGGLSFAWYVEEEGDDYE